jgi:hypothetical protein
MRVQKVQPERVVFAERNVIEGLRIIWIGPAPDKQLRQIFGPWVRWLTGFPGSNRACQRLKVGTLIIGQRALAGRARIQQCRGNSNGVLFGRGDRKPSIADIFERQLRIERGRLRSSAWALLQNPFNLGEIAAYAGRVDVARDDLRVTLQDTRGVFPSRCIIIITLIPAAGSRTNAVAKARMFEELRQQYFMTAGVDRRVCERDLEEGPAARAVFTGKRSLNVAQTGLEGGAGI